MMNGQFCSEAWDCISRYVYAALQGGAIMRGWTNDEKVMIACCNDGTRLMIFKLERIDEEESFRMQALLGNGHNNTTDAGRKPVSIKGDRYGTN